MAHGRVGEGSPAMPQGVGPAIDEAAPRPATVSAEEVARLATRLRSELDAAGLDAIDPPRAEWLAVHVHRGQTDRLGVAYIDHPRAVAELADGLVERLPPPQRTMRLREQVHVAALLHDTLEDTPLTTADLAVARVPDPVIRAIEALTKRDGEAYADAVRRAALDPLARLVKAADLMHNTEPERTRQLREHDDGEAAARLAARYTPARAFLLEVIALHGINSVTSDDLRAIEEELEQGVGALG